MSRDSKEYFLGIDFGTQGVRCGIVDEVGEIISVAHDSYMTYYPEPGWVVQSPDEWVASMFRAAKACIDNADESVVQTIKGISVCATASTVVPVMQDGTRFDGCYPLDG